MVIANMEYKHPWIPITHETQKAMLKIIGRQNIEDLFQNIPEKYRLKRDLNLPESHSELAVTRRIQELAQKNREILQTEENLKAAQKRIQTASEAEEKVKELSPDYETLLNLRSEIQGLEKEYTTYTEAQREKELLVSDIDGEREKYQELFRRAKEQLGAVESEIIALEKTVEQISPLEKQAEELQEETERTFDSITRYMSDSDRKQFDTQNALLNLTGSIYAEMRMNRTLEYLRDIAKVDLESEETSEEPVEDIKGDADDTEKEGQADQDDIENNELDKNESDLDEVTSEGDEQSLDDDEGEADQKNTE